MSTRPKKKKPVQSDNNSSKDRRWTVREKTDLLESIKKHGLADLNKLSADIQTRTVAEVKMFLDNRRRKLQEEMNKQQQSESVSSTLAANQNIIVWCNKVREAVDFKHRGKDYSVVLQEILEEAAHSESDCIPSEGEPDFSLLYTYVERALSGYLPPSLPPLESWLMLSAWRSLTDTIKQGNWQQEKEFLSGLHLRENAPLDPVFKKVKGGYWKVAHDFHKNPPIISSHASDSHLDAPSCSSSLQDVLKQINTNSVTKEIPSGSSDISDGHLGAPSCSSASQDVSQKTDLNSCSAEVSSDSADVSNRPLQTSMAEATPNVPSETQLCNTTAERKYPIYNSHEHQYAFVLASLNPLTVPVDMLEKETEIVFHK